MAKLLPEDLGDGGVGDLTSVFHQRSVSDLRWLDVDPEEYRKFEALPKQNLDFIPEVTEFLAREPDERVPTLIVQRPITVVNSNPLEQASTPSRSSNIENLKSKLASFVIADLPAQTIKDRLLLEYSPGQLRSASADIQAILEERGLLGNVYINASHFPRCHQPKDASRAFVARYATNSKFVVAKSACTDCVCNSGGSCTAFKKRIVDSVPYSRKLLASYSGKLVRENRISLNVLNSIPSDSDGVETILRDAFRRSVATGSPETAQVAHTQRKPSRPVVTDDDVHRFVAARASAEKPVLPSPEVLNALSSLTKGHSPTGLRHSTDSQVRKAANEHGLVGHTYLDIDALGGPKATLGFINFKRLAPDFLVGRLAYELTDELTQLVKAYPIFGSRPGLGSDNLKTALFRAVDSHRMDRDSAESAWAVAQSATEVDWERVIREVNLYSPPVEETVAEYAGPRMSFYHGDTSSDLASASTIIPEEVRRTISHLMNAGHYGARLQNVILSRYTKEDLGQVPEVGQALASLDGVQGYYHIDPTAYADYGKGCNIGSKSLRHNHVQNVLACDKCTGCRLQTAPGWCSKYAKKLVRSVPESAHREAAQRLTLPVIQSYAPVENPVEKFGLAAEIHIDLNGTTSKPFDISIQSGSLSD